jgi:hypothetical protein
MLLCLFDFSINLLLRARADADQPFIPLLLPTNLDELGATCLAPRFETRWQPALPDSQ